MGLLVQAGGAGGVCWEEDEVITMASQRAQRYYVAISHDIPDSIQHDHPRLDILARLVLTRDQNHPGRLAEINGDGLQEAVSLARSQGLDDEYLEGRASIGDLSLNVFPAKSRGGGSRVRITQLFPFDFDDETRGPKFPALLGLGIAHHALKAVLCSLAQRLPADYKIYFPGNSNDSKAFFAKRGITPNTPLPLSEFIRRMEAWEKEKRM